MERRHNTLFLLLIKYNTEKEIPFMPCSLVATVIPHQQLRSQDQSFHLAPDEKENIPLKGSYFSILS